MSKFFIYIRGGLGDTIRRYTSGGDGWEYLSSLKEKFPETKIRLIVMSSNPQTAEFFKYHPLIDNIVIGKWENPNQKTKHINEYCDDYIKLLGNPILDGLEKQPTGKVYLDSEDKKTILNVTKEEKYIVIHPFASENRKITLPIKEYFPLVDDIIDNLNLRVIVIGADWIQTRAGAPKVIKEKFPYNRPGLVNLTNKINSRVATFLVQKSYGLIATRSYCFSSTVSGNIKAVLLVAEDYDKSYPGVKWTIQNLKQWG